MVYSTGAASLAVLEILVHMHEPPGLSGFTLLSIDVPENLIELLDESALPAGWDSAITPDSVQTIGDTWIQQSHALALAVPSAILPIEYNYLLNPQHTAFQSIVAKAQQVPFEFDERLFKSF